MATDGMQFPEIPNGMSYKAVSYTTSPIAQVEKYGLADHCAYMVSIFKLNSVKDGNRRLLPVHLLKPLMEYLKIEVPDELYVINLLTVSKQEDITLPELLQILTDEHTGDWSASKLKTLIKEARSFMHKNEKNKKVTVEQLAQFTHEAESCKEIEFWSLENFKGLATNLDALIQFVKICVVQSNRLGILDNLADGEAMQALYESCIQAGKNGKMICMDYRRLLQNLDHKLTQGSLTKTIQDLGMNNVDEIPFELFNELLLTQIMISIGFSL